MFFGFAFCFFLHIPGCRANHLGDPVPPPHRQRSAWQASRLRGSPEEPAAAAAAAEKMEGFPAMPNKKIDKNKDGNPQQDPPLPNMYEPTFNYNHPQLVAATAENPSSSSASVH